MSDFKTPLPLRTPTKSNLDNICGTPRKCSDSDESVASTPAGSTESLCSNEDISIVAEFDDLMRVIRHLKGGKFEAETAFGEFMRQTASLYDEYLAVLNECRRTQGLLNVKVQECSDSEGKLIKARKMIDQERARSRMFQRERDEWRAKVAQAQRILFKDNNRNGSNRFDDIIDQLTFLNDNYEEEIQRPVKNNLNNGLSAIAEVNSTGSILSDFSYSRSEDDLDGSLMHGRVGMPWKKHRPSSEGICGPAIKKRRSSGAKVVEISPTETVRATTTVTVSKHGPIMATSIIESIPGAKEAAAPESTTLTNGESNPSGPPPKSVLEAWGCGSPRKPERNVHVRQHSLQQKMMVMPDTCGICEKRIRFGKTAMKCKDCKSICHPECKILLPLPCVPCVGTPNKHHELGFIGDYTPTTPPMVPALLIHCINEIELRGLTEVGIYRVPGSERDVKALKEKFLSGKGIPSLVNVDVHVICGVVKDFLRRLKEPLITFKQWKRFVDLAESGSEEAPRKICQLVMDLPQPNRDSLSYMIIHLQKVAESRECKMNVSNLARVFGPTIVGYSSEDPDPQNLLREVSQFKAVMEAFLNIGADFWLPFINVESTRPSRMQQTPSTDSLIPPPSKSLFTPTRPSKRQKFFASPKF